MSEELKQLLESLKDPEAVLVNMMRGTIATPSARAISKLFGEVVNGEDAQLLEIARLRAELAAIKAGQGEAVVWHLPDVETSTVLHSAWLKLSGEGQPSIETLKSHYSAISAALADSAPPATGDAVSVVLFKTLSDAVSELSVLNSYAREVANDDDDEESQEVCDSTDESIEHMQAVLNKYRALLAQSQGVKP